MLLIPLFACILVAVAAAIHAVGLAVLLKALNRSHALSTTSFHVITGLLISLTTGLILIHLAEITYWFRATACGIGNLLNRCLDTKNRATSC